MKHSLNTSSFTDYGNVYCTKYAIGKSFQTENLQDCRNDTITLSADEPYLTLDFGTEVAGFPFFDISTLSGPTQLEVKYAENFPAILEPQSDGPWSFSNGLSNSFRVETFNITTPGYTESFFVQGGQRWQTVKLITNTSIDIKIAGFRSTSPHIAIDELPGQLRTDNEIYGRIHGLGGRVVQAACVDKGNAPSTWSITSEGALIPGQTSAISINGLNAANYTLHFDTKIQRGGTGWKVASSVSPYGPYFVLTSEYPEGSALLNTNRTLVPPNTLIFNYGWGLLNQTTVQTGWNEYYPLNMTISEGKWYRVSTTIEETGYRIEIDGQTVAFVPVFQAAILANSGATYFGTRSPYLGSWGFGPFQDQIAYVKNVTVTASNQTQIYHNDMTSEAILAEYNVASLDHSICLDGAKRDRLVWTGDFYHTVRVLAQSTARWDYILGSIDYVYSYQLDSGIYNGLVPISPSMGSRPENKESYSSGYGGLLDYQDLFLAGVAHYYHYTGDVQGMQPYWNHIKSQVTAKLAFVDPYSGLVANSPNFPSSNFLGPINGSAVTGLFAYALQQLVPLAEALNDTATGVKYIEASQKLKDALNTQLWNEELGTYSFSVDNKGNFSINGIAWAILSGAANETQAISSLSKLDELQLGVGYKSISSDADSEEYQLSPNVCGFLLEALFKTQRSTFLTNSDNSSTSIPAVATHLLDNLWGSMLNPTYESGASWEYVHPDGSPGLDLYTSLAHPWGAAPTYILSEYLLGIEAVEPGYKTFQVTPLIGYLGLKQVNGTVPTPHGAIGVSWAMESKNVSMEVEVPAGTSGTLRLPKDATGIVDGRTYSNGTIELGSGTKASILLKLA